MSAFILKINGDTRCPGGINIPSSIQDWAHGDFFTKRITPSPSTYADGKNGPEPEQGDRVYIWVNENGKDSRGGGLTAVATISLIEPETDRYRLKLSDLAILKNWIGMNRAYAAFPSSRLVNELKRYRLERIWALGEDDIHTIEALIETAGGLRLGTDIDPISEALLQSSENIKAAIVERKSALAKIRPGQAAFREAAIERHNGRCVFTKTSTLEVLEAAHVIPHTGEPQFERPDNSLLLRRDVHALFDLFLLGLDPVTGKILVSPKLENSIYAKLQGRVVDHKLAPAALSFHAEQFSRVIES
ncbi:conserved hypothetical protein [Roseovarius sp. EC-HK134]|uniref:HNH endonuclease signature motif containing protein n=1 Tax=unclassified Roseovarius TaxID=2614913 RepID=UPI0012564A38|nr:MULTISPECIES: HNH endonuclease signature motif containing protein [unclassified Roseovarius]VVT33600.1 conserved hypothetical protein [Roseovarius sp. EC-HK134]VVT33736.1 conserved hypothetical protein [Roseovarius sp. EC-SD190]